MHRFGRARLSVFSRFPFVLIFLTVAFDHGFAYGILYDDFTSDLVHHPKWTRLEFVRRIDNGQLVSTLTRFGTNGSNNLSFVDPQTVNPFQTDVTVIAVSNSAAEPRVRLAGFFYDDSTPGEGNTGEILAEVRMHPKGLGTHVSRIDGPNEGASIAATFDNVLVSAQCLHDGDVNQDNSITPADALLAFQQFLGLADPPLDA
jgi:hypothetical protein